MAESVETFYDDLAESYHLMFENWNHTVARQAAIIGPLLERYTARVPLTFWTARAGSEPRPSV